MITPAIGQFLIAPFKGAPDDITVHVVKDVFAEVKGSSDFSLLEYSEHMITERVSEAFLVSQKYLKDFKDMGVSSIYFVKMYEDGTLRELKSSIDSVINLAGAGLISKLQFRLNVESIHYPIFVANCDTLGDVPMDIVDGVLNAILLTNPEMDRELLLDSVQVSLHTHMPCLDLEPIGVDLNDPKFDFDFCSSRSEYSCSVVDGFRVKFSGNCPPYPVKASTC